MLLLVPVCPAKFKIIKESFFRSTIHAYEIKYAVVCYEGFESFVMMTFQPVGRKATEAGSYTAHPVFINKRFLAYAVDGAEQVLHALSSPIAADVVVPLFTERRNTPAVRRYDY